ncbi:MAG: ketopantoate reductase family protein [Candidatus Nanopelagicales bacterium]
MSARILIVGAGAIGGVTAAHLTRAGHDVVVLDANAEHVRLVGDPGLVLDELGATSIIPIAAVASPHGLAGRFDFALTTLKAPFIEAALSPLVADDRVDTYVSCGNGLVQDRVEALVGRERLLIGIVEWGATNVGPGHVAQTTVAPFVIGEIDGTETDRLERLASVLRSAGEVRVSRAIFGQVWSKLLLNSTFSGLGAVSGLVYSGVVAELQGDELAFALWAEGHAVASAVGVVLDEVAGIHPDRLLVRTPADRPAAVNALGELMARLGPTKASMLQDLERHAPTEIDVINGGVVAQAERLGLAAPFNRRIVELVRECESGARTPRPDNLDELRLLLP